MPVRLSTNLETKVGFDGSLDDCLWDRAPAEVVDSMDHAESIVGTLAAGQNNLALSLGSVSQARYVAIEADGDVDVAFGGVAATAASIVGVGGTFNTGFTGGETFIVTVDGTVVTATFALTDQTLAQVVNRINSDAALLGIAPIASESSGEVLITSPTTGDTSTLLIGSGTANGVLGFTAAATSTGVNANPSTSDLPLRRLGNTNDASAVANLKAYAALTLQTTSITLSNPSSTTSVRYRVLVVGDLAA